MSDTPRSLYEADPKIQARSVKGRYANLRIIAVFLLLGLFYGLPWLSWNGMPLVLFDLPARRFHLFGLTLVPQDLFLLTGLLILAAMTLFLFTTLAGRLWCGYACPQTVWTEVFMWMEAAVEGDRRQRQKLDRSPWNGHKIARRGTKHLLWLLFALWTGFSFVGFFVPIQQLWADLLAWKLTGWSMFWILFYGFATWGNAGFMREQVCRYMCPYARFQSAMFDRDTLIIAYDPKRGEPRKMPAREQREQDIKELGDCIDCTLCVQVCPTGIDIRDGLQYECIACAACVDACDHVMEQVNKPKGLIHYTTARKDAGGSFHFLRPRVIGYGLVWMVIAGALISAIVLRAPLQLDVLRDRHTLVRELASGEIENIYTLKLTNKTSQIQTVHVSVSSPDGITPQLSRSSFELAPYQTAREVVSVTAQASTATSYALNFEASWPGKRAKGEARFIGIAQ